MNTLTDEVIQEIRKFFGDQFRLELEEENEELFLNIVVGIDVCAAAEKFDNFCDAWWLNNMNRADYKLHIGLGFV